MIGNAIRSELYKLRKRPGTWIVGGVWLSLALGFGFLVPYIVYLAIRANPEPPPDSDPEALLAGLLPEQLAITAPSMYPLFGAAMMLVLGAVVGGGEYRWGTWSSALTQLPTRAAVCASQVGSLVVAFAGITLATFGLTGLASVAVSAIEGEAIVWPQLADTAGALGVMWLISIAWGALGYVLAVAFRSAATGIAVGLVWGLVLENAVSGMASMVRAFEVAQQALLSVNSGSLVSALGASAVGEGGTPGVAAINSGPVAITVLVAYTVAFAGLAVWLMQRRDVA